MSIFNSLKIGMISLLLFSSVSFADDKQVSLSYVNYPPYYGKDMENGGPLTEIIVSAFENQGYQVKLKQLPWKRALNSTKQGKFDGLFTGWYREERKEFFTFSDALPSNEIVLLKRKDINIEYTDYSDLKPYKIGVVNGYVNPEGFDEAGLTLETATKDKQNIQKLGSSRIDLVLIDKAMSKHIIRTELPQLKDKLEWLEPPLRIETQHIMFSKNAINYQQKVDDFNTGLKNITDSGEFQKILNKHGL